MEDDLLEFGSSYVADLNAVTTNVYVTMNPHYALKNTEVTGRHLRIKLPADSVLAETPLHLDGKLCKDYTYESGRLIVPVTSDSGELKFSVKMEQHGEFCVS